MKKIRYGLLILAAVGMLTGCTKGTKVGKTTLYVDDNGKVTEAIVEKLDKEYYDADEMKEWIEKEVKSYKEEHGKVVDLKKYKAEKDTARVIFEYDSMEDYSDFNNIHAFCGTIARAEKAGYTFEGEFISAKDKPSVTRTELEGSEKYHAVIVDSSQVIVLEHDILYASPNVKVSGKKATVNTTAGELAYIIYK